MLEKNQLKESLFWVNKPAKCVYMAKAQIESKYFLPLCFILNALAINRIAVKFFDFQDEKYWFCLFFFVCIRCYMLCVCPPHRYELPVCLPHKASYVIQSLVRLGQHHDV